MPQKLPYHVADSDDLVIVLGGVEYRPHQGEAVVFRPGRQTMRDAMLQLRAVAIQAEVTREVEELQKLPPDSNISEETSLQLLAKRQELQALVCEVTDRLAARIVSWTWTDNDGNRYPSPPTGELLQTLEQEEIEWLRRQVEPERQSESKNGSLPST